LCEKTLQYSYPRCFDISPKISAPDNVRGRENARRIQTPTVPQNPSNFTSKPPDFDFSSGIFGKTHHITAAAGKYRLFTIESLKYDRQAPVSEAKHKNKSICVSEASTSRLAQKSRAQNFTISQHIFI
jgi:hypothetical protein